MKKAHRIALEPTPEQEALFNQHAGYARFAYNWAVAEFKAGLDVGEWLSELTLRPRWNRVKGMIAPWGAVLSQNAAKYAVIDFGQAAEGWGEYRRNVKAGQRPARRVGFPRFKRRKHEQGFRADNGPDTVKVDGRVVILPKIGRVAMVEHLRFAGSIREVTVKRTADTWFACFCIEDGEKAPAVKDGPASAWTWAWVPWRPALMGSRWRTRRHWPAVSSACGVWTRPLPAAETSMAGAIVPTAGNACTPRGDGFTLGWSTSGTTTITRRPRR